MLILRVEFRPTRVVQSSGWTGLDNNKTSGPTGLNRVGCVCWTGWIESTILPKRVGLRVRLLFEPDPLPTVARVNRVLLRLGFGVGANPKVGLEVVVRIQAQVPTNGGTDGEANHHLD